MVRTYLKLFAAPVILGLITSIATGCAHMTISVRNDTQQYLRVAGCVDDAVDVAPDDTFTAEGRSESNALICWITYPSGLHRCVAVRNVEGMRGDVPLSRAIDVSPGKC